MHDAREQARTIEYDVVLLDWMLPDGDGVELLREWRRAGLRTPVLLLTARGTVPERVTGLRAGADDYLPKPFDFDELLARIEALHRRAEGAIDLRRVGDVALDGRRRAIRFGASEVALTAREHALAAELFSHAGEVITRAHLLRSVWGSGFEGDPNVLDVYVGYLRQKLARASAPLEIRSVRGVGFRLVSREEPDA
ncbi:Phosphate regulon transcriptional regulatory protein PhoB [Sandaracinus amylolyticus]|uniref:Phosphate regulon transcriptional regulatory protein PhoB n=1 Tax=Sandaracinus amylolyticus TaxID=927083 RepID=A0A0F6W695_9BACT|nr:Phosphate regulon transcriptional regulatory protein PhoB [Sandaracinus amylolyticus]